MAISKRFPQFYIILKNLEGQFIIGKKKLCLFKPKLTQGFYL